MGERIKAREVHEEVRSILRRFAERHLGIEENMISVYMGLAEKSSHPLIKKLAEGLAENEREHHRYLLELIEKLK